MREMNLLGIERPIEESRNNIGRSPNIKGSTIMAKHGIKQEKERIAITAPNLTIVSEEGKVVARADEKESSDPRGELGAPDRHQGRRL